VLLAVFRISYRVLITSIYLLVIAEWKCPYVLPDGEMNLDIID